MKWLYLSRLAHFVGRIHDFMIDSSISISYCILCGYGHDHIVISISVWIIFNFLHEILQSSLSLVTLSVKDQLHHLSL